MSATLERLVVMRRRLAALLLLLAPPAYYVAFQLDPWVFGVLLLGLGPAQIAVAVLGIFARLARGGQSDTAVDWVVDLLLVATAVAAFVFVRTISWT